MEDRDIYDEIRKLLWEWQEEGESIEFIEEQLDDLKGELEG